MPGPIGTNRCKHVCEKTVAEVFFQIYNERVNNKLHTCLWIMQGFDWIGGMHALVIYIFAKDNLQSLQFLLSFCWIFHIQIGLNGFDGWGNWMRWFMQAGEVAMYLIIWIAFFAVITWTSNRFQPDQLDRKSHRFKTTAQSNNIICHAAILRKRVWKHVVALRMHN